MVLPLEEFALLSPFLATLAGGADVTEEDLEAFSLASSTVQEDIFTVVVKLSREDFETFNTLL